MIGKIIKRCSLWLHLLKKKLQKSTLYDSEMWMLDLDIHWLKLHVVLENPGLIVSFILSNTKGWLAHFVRSELTSNR